MDQRGCKVRVRTRHQDGTRVQDLGRRKENSLEGKIGNESPVGKALLGKQVGDTAVVETQNGSFKYKVLGIQRDK